VPLLPTGRCAALVALTAGLCLVAPLVGVAALVGVLALSAFDAVQARRPAVTRTAPPFLVRGVPGTLRLTVDGPGEVTQPGTEALEVAGLTLTARRRGRHVLPPAVARCRGPLGLGQWSGPVTEPAEVVVHPDVLAARRLARGAHQATFDEESGRARGPLGLGTSFESLRDYQPDDDVRLINWKASARSGRPVVNQFRLEQSRDVVLLLDAGRLMTAATGPSPAPTVFDVAVDAATALALTVDAVGDRCGLIAFADRPLARLAPRAGGGRAVAAALSAIEAASVDSDFETAFRALPTKRCVAIVLTDLVDDAAAAALQLAVPVLSRRHQVLVVAPDDPMLAAMVGAGGGGGRAAFRAAAAASLLEERDRAAAMLRRAAARVVSAPPERLPAAACAGYLDLKARARA
jgi:uncharacterized protein (DUF58 family)